MPYPPPLPPNARTNATPQVDNHPADHNLISDALTEIINHLSVVESTISPIGCITIWPGDVLPTNHVWCRGQAESRTAYPELFAIYGTKFGAGDGTTTFNMPNFQGTVPVGFNTTVNTPANAVGSFTLGVGERAGSNVLSMPAHAHGVNIWSGYQDVDHSHTVSINSGGQSANHYHAPNGGAADYLMGGGSPGAGALLKGGSAQPYSGQTSTNWASGDHYHHVYGATSGMSVNHRHAINGNSDTAAAVGSAFQPSLSVNFAARAH